MLIKIKTTGNCQTIGNLALMLRNLLYNLQYFTRIFSPEKSCDNFTMISMTFVLFLFDPITGSKIYWSMIEASSDIPRTSLPIFVYVWKPSDIFVKCSEMFALPSDNSQS